MFWTIQYFLKSILTLQQDGIDLIIYYHVENWIIYFVQKDITYKI